MNLKEETNKKCFSGIQVYMHVEKIVKSKKSGGNTHTWIKKEDAIEIAEKYAEEMCKKQKQLCAEVYVKQRQMILESNFDVKLNETFFSDVLENASLATEIK